jgi:hypothetical protein
VGTTKFILGLTASVSTLAAAFCFGFTAAGVVATVSLGSGFLGLAAFLVAVTSGFLCAPVTG